MSPIYRKIEMFLFESESVGEEAWRGTAIELDSN